MPSIRQGGGYTLTFSKKNKDVKSHLDTLKEDGVTITDYICKAIRFYEENKNNSFDKKVIDSKEIEILVGKQVAQILSEYNKEVNLQFNQQGELLEHDLDHIKDEDMEED